MSLLNSKTIMLLVLVAVASWNFPWGVVTDVGIGSHGSCFKSMSTFVQDTSNS